jgi:hypothetical protein
MIQIRQWSGVSENPVHAADVGWVSIFLQNCVAAPRKVHLTLQDPDGFLTRSGALRWPVLIPVELGPGDVGAPAKLLGYLPFHDQLRP